MTDTFTIADHHFENAGIEPDKIIEQSSGDNKGTEDKADEIDLESGIENPVKELQEKSGDKVDKKPADAGKDSDGSGTDDGKKEKSEEKEPQPNRTEAELDAAALDEARNSKPVRAEIAQRWMHQRDTARQERDASKNVIQRLTTETDQLKQQVETYKTASTIIGELQPAEVPGAVRLYSALKANPVATLKQLLAEAKANGHTVDGIGEGVDTLAIQRILDQRLKPFEQNNSQTQQKPQESRTVENDTELFYQSYKDAELHDDILGEMLNKNIADVRAGKAQRLMTNTELYFTLKEAAVAQGYDFSKPLKPQIDARKQTPQVQQKQEEKVDPTPRISGNGGLQNEPLIPTGSADESFGDIVKRALANSKMQTN